MAELDEFLDSLLQQRNAPQATYIDDSYADILEIKKTSSRGHGVFAKRFLPVDEPICALSCPMVTAIDTECLPTTCYYCLIATSNHLPIPGYGDMPVELKVCNGCRVARFCNKDCQIRSWHAYHKYECKIFKKLKHNFPSAIFRAVLRMVLLRDRDLLSEEEWTRTVSLTAHEHLLAEGGRSNITEIAESIKILAGSSMSVNMIQKLVFIMKFNAIELPTPIYGGIGVMLIPLIGKINHSCEPNLAVHRPQHTMVSSWLHSPQLSEGDRSAFIQIVPLRGIGEGEELLNCYIAPTESVGARKAKLSEDYFFDCNCGRCSTDITTISNLSKEQPVLTVEFEQWAQEMRRYMSQIGSNAGTLQKAVACMDKSGRFSEHSTLCSTGELPQAAMTIIFQGLKAKALDVSVVNLFRIHLLVNPRRFVGRHNPTNVYTVFLLLDVLDVILEVSIAPGITAELIEKLLHALSSRGISKRSLVHWRYRIIEDLRKRLDRSAIKDLEGLLEKRKGQGCHFLGTNQIVERNEVRETAEQEMRVILKLRESSWKFVLQDAGC